MAVKKNQIQQLFVVILLIIFYTFLVMTIWNSVIIKKLPTSHIQPLTFWDALALAVFVSLLGTHNIFA